MTCGSDNSSNIYGWAKINLIIINIINYRIGLAEALPETQNAANLCMYSARMLSDFFSRIVGTYDYFI